MKPIKYDPMDERFACCTPAIRFVKSTANRLLPSLKAKKNRKTVTVHASCAYCKRLWETGYDHENGTWTTPVTKASKETT